MDQLLEVTVLFTLILALSFLVERFLEIIKSIYDLLDSRFHWCKFYTRRANHLKNKLERRLHIFEYVDQKTAASVLNRFQEFILRKKEAAGPLPVLSGDLVRATTVKIASKFIGILIGIGVAIWMKIDLLTIWREAAGDSLRWVDNIGLHGLRITLSGIILGLGSGPVHKIITTMDKKRKERAEKGA